MPDAECICMTAADLGFSGWGDGVNPNLIAATHPDCPQHGSTPCGYDGCPYPTNPRYNHDHPWTCSECGYTWSATARYCAFCGAHNDQPTAPNQGDQSDRLAGDD